MSDDFDVDDIAAIRREEGAAGIKALMRAQLAIGKARREQPAPKPARRPTGRPPGAWPTGSRPPDPLKSQPPGAWDHALDRYRAGEGSDRDPCGCGGCDTPDNAQEDQ
ncbi:hypothetical protein EAO71_27290 [Streptomyces sp. ms191]|uniref:hypothetical protein n=1 Tax=Streptomyces sp. ms191 TaxID=1827978 RepID=UPI0011CDFBDC|nr:hypothetical protein [Streptomyces sp. ms191]TXS21407.1 hypothetical protein EAO71_27290 [Streptomyces sp. ms191]